MRHVRLLLVAVLAVLLAVSSAQSAFAGTWIIYDDGTAEGLDLHLGEYIAVRFSAPAGSVLLRIAYYRVFTTEIAFDLYILDSNGQTVLFGPQSTTPVGPEGWFYVDVNIIVPGDFYAAIYWPVPDPFLGVDTDNHGQTFQSSTLGNWQPYLYHNEQPANMMIRAELESAAVGGIVTPANAFALLSPWLAVIALAGCIGVVGLLVKRRRL
jgi:hypothetical protein